MKRTLACNLPNIDILIDSWYNLGLDDDATNFVYGELNPAIAWQTLGLNLAIAGMCEFARRLGA